MKKSAIYPITKDNQYLLQMMNSTVCKFNIEYAVVPNAYKNSVKETNQIKVFNKIEDVIDEVDNIIFINNHDIKRMYNEMVFALESYKNIITTIDFSDKQIEELKNTADKFGVMFVTLTKENLFAELDFRGDVFTPQESVVIAVGGLMKGISTSKIITELFYELYLQNYRAKIITWDSNLLLLDSTYFPIDKIINNNLEHAIVQINRLVNLVQLESQADVIIIQLPDEGLHRMSNEFATCFGARTYLISQAVCIDYSVILTPCIYVDAKMYKYLSDISYYRYGFQYNCIGVVNKTINTDIPQGTDMMSYYSIPNETVERYIASLRQEKEANILFFNPNDNVNKMIIADMIENLS